MKVVPIILVALLTLTLSAPSHQQQEQIVFQEEFPESQPSDTQPTIPPQQSTLKEQPQTPTPPLPQRKPFQFNKQTLLEYKFQVMAVMGVFIYLMSYVRGKSANADIIQRFYKAVSHYISENFAHIGFSKESGEDPFIGESANEAMFFATGRDNVEYIQMRFNLRTRQDLLYYFIYELFFPIKDTIVIDIPVKADVPCVLLLAQKRKIKEITAANLDIAKLTTYFGVANLQQSYEILGESAESVDYLIDNYAVKKLNEMNGLFISIHYTDQKLFSESNGHLRVTLNAGHKNAAQFQSALDLILHLADRAAHMKLSVNAKAKAAKSRQAFNQSKQKEQLQKHQQEMRKKKEQKKKDEEAWIRSLPADKQKREDEKRKKKEMNKMLKGRTMKVM